MSLSPKLDREECNMGQAGQYGGLNTAGASGGNPTRQNSPDGSIGIPHSNQTTIAFTPGVYEGKPGWVEKKVINVYGDKYYPDTGQTVPNQFLGKTISFYFYPQEQYPQKPTQEHLNDPFVLPLDPQYYDAKGNPELTSGLGSSLAALDAALSNPVADWYAYQVSLLTGNVIISYSSATALSDLEVGSGGTASVIGGTYSDLYIWNQKNVSWRTTGAGNTLYFMPFQGEDVQAPGELVLNL
jgi:hypothetical protein